MTKKSRKLKWERVDDGYDLVAKNITKKHTKKLEKLLQDVERPTPDFNKRFSSYASQKFREWFDEPSKALPEAAYTLLSNWPLSGSKAARESSRAEAAWVLWDDLFCARPRKRLSNWRISGRKVIPKQFKKWWPKQLKCQKDC